MENRFRKGSLACILLLLLSIIGPRLVLAQEYPNKPVALVVPFGPGGESDLIGRGLASVAMDYLGQPLLIQLSRSPLKFY